MSWASISYRGISGLYWPVTASFVKMAGMYYTPARPVKRRLAFSSARPAKRFRKTNTSGFRRINKRTTKGPRTSGTLIQQVKSLQQIVKNLAPEIKYLDTSLVINDIASTGSVVHLTAVAQGDTQVTRTGNTINVKTLHWQLLCRAPLATQTSTVRYAIVMDKEQVGDTAPAITDVFTSNDPVVALPSLDNLERFRILYISPMIDCQSIIQGSIVTTIRKTTQFDWSGNIKVSYNGTAGTDIEKNGIWLLVLTDDSTSSMDFEGVCRIGYTDV